MAFTLWKENSIFVAGRGNMIFRKYFRPLLRQGTVQDSGLSQSSPVRGAKAGTLTVSMMAAISFLFLLRGIPYTSARRLAAASTKSMWSVLAGSKVSGWGHFFGPDQKGLPVEVTCQIAEIDFLHYRIAM